MPIPDAKIKPILLGIMKNSKSSEKLKETMIDNFVDDMANVSFQLSWTALKQSIENNDANNTKLNDIIMHANGCINCMKLTMFP